MANVSFESLHLAAHTDIKNIAINTIGAEGQVEETLVEVKQYLTAEDKNAILECAMQAADSATIINTFALDVLLDLYIVLKYTNLEFTEQELDDKFKLYDRLETNGIIEKVIAAIPSYEYDILRTNLEEMKNNYAIYRNSARGILEQLSVFAPNAAANIGEQLKDFDTEKFTNVIQLADALGINNEMKIK